MLCRMRLSGCEPKRFSVTIFVATCFAPSRESALDNLYVLSASSMNLVVPAWNCVYCVQCELEYVCVIGKMSVRIREQKVEDLSA